MDLKVLLGITSALEAKHLESERSWLLRLHTPISPVPLSETVVVADLLLKGLTIVSLIGICF
jgi:hypothetical protein